MYMANINLPIDNTLVEKVDAARGKQPRVSWIRDAIADKLAIKSASPEVARVTTGREGSEEKAGGLPEDNPAHVSSADSPLPPSRSPYRFSVDECEHKFEARGKCLACGRVR